MQDSARALPVLGIETSCDETAAAILDADGNILAEAVHSQTGHAGFGGVVPEIAARAHLEILPGLIAACLHRAGFGVAGLGAVAATVGPGLIGGLIAGSSLAKGIALARGIPFIPVNHLEAHALAARLPGIGPEGAPFPYLLLLLSGGHCQCIEVLGVGEYRLLGATVDDAAGEAFDKVAKLLGLPWPGGPALERLAAQGNPRAFVFPRPLLGRPGCDFSFSGLKTAVAQAVARLGEGALPVSLAADLAASFQAAVAAVIADRATHALALTQAKLLVVAGGAAANATIRAAINDVTARAGVRFLAPPLRLCTDNAVMVAWAAIERLRAGAAANLGKAAEAGLGFAPRPRWRLDSPDMRAAAE